MWNDRNLTSFANILSELDETTALILVAFPALINMIT